jgi:hypothetical protein
MLATVPRSVAMKAQTKHQFLHGIGYVPHGGPPDIPTGAQGGKNCLPATGAANGSIHILKPSHGAPPMRMRWVAAEQAWAGLNQAKGNRLAWTADHLSRAGWEYVGVDPKQEPVAPDATITTGPYRKKR